MTFRSTRQPIGGSFVPMGLASSAEGVTA